MDEVKKEMKIRKRLLDIYNKTHEDFDSKEDFDEYLEDVEDIIYNLVNGIDVELTERKVIAYERENADLILQNHAKKADEARRKAAAAAAESHFSGPTTPADEDDAAEEAAAALAATTIKPEVIATYNPGAAMSTVLNVQPNPLKEVELNRDGFIVSPNPGPVHISAAQQRAGGWSSDISRKRQMEEAFSQLFVF